MVKLKSCIMENTLTDRTCPAHIGNSVGFKLPLSLERLVIHAGFAP